MTDCNDEIICDMTDLIFHENYLKRKQKRNLEEKIISYKVLPNKINTNLLHDDKNNLSRDVKKFKNEKIMRISKEKEKGKIKKLEQNQINNKTDDDFYKTLGIGNIFGSLMDEVIKKKPVTEIITSEAEKTIQNSEVVNYDKEEKNNKTENSNSSLKNNNNFYIRNSKFNDGSMNSNNTNKEYLKKSNFKNDSSQMKIDQMNNIISNNKNDKKQIHISKSHLSNNNNIIDRRDEVKNLSISSDKNTSKNNNINNNKIEKSEDKNTCRSRNYSNSVINFVNPNNNNTTTNNIINNYPYKNSNRYQQGSLPIVKINPSYIEDLIQKIDLLINSLNLNEHNNEHNNDHNNALNENSLNSSQIKKYPTSTIKKINPFISFYKSTIEDPQLQKHLLIEPTLKINFIKKFPNSKKLITKHMLFNIINNSVDRIINKFPIYLDNNKEEKSESNYKTQKNLYYVKLIKNDEERDLNYNMIFVTENILKKKMNVEKIEEENLL